MRSLTGVVGDQANGFAQGTILCLRSIEQNGQAVSRGQQRTEMTVRSCKCQTVTNGMEGLKNMNEYLVGKVRQLDL